MSALLTTISFTDQNLTTLCALGTPYTNNTGLDLVVQVFVGFTGLADDSAETLAVSLHGDPTGIKQVLNTTVTVNKLGSTSMELNHGLQYFLKAGSKLGVKCLASDAGDNVVSGTVDIVAMNIVDVYSVGGATPVNFDTVPSSITTGSWGDWIRKAARQLVR